MGKEREVMSDMYVEGSREYGIRMYVRMGTEGSRVAKMGGVEE